jgi:NhaP-type Na+/H+ or K+/H+ antiporter
MLVSWILYYREEEGLLQVLRFDDETFFYFCLPPIVFASGFNMQRGNFFKNFKTIMLFGIFGTFVAFFSFSGMTIYLKNLGFMKQYDGETGQWSDLELTSPECMLMCSLLCSSDVIAAVSLLSFDKQPDLYSIVFGEGITNDAVSIILFNTVMKYTSANTEIVSSTPFTIIGEFLLLGACSVGLGVLFAVLASLTLKQFRLFTRNPVNETFMVFIFGYLAYVTSEVFEQSGIISLLTAGVVMAKYAWFNLSPQGKQSSFIVFQCLGYLAEAFVFGYLGLTFFTFSELKWSPQLFVAELAVIVVGRLMGTLGLMGLAKLCGYKSTINLKELIFIWYAGMIRGAIAFGLVLRIDESYVNRGVIVTTSLSLVVFTTVFYGSTVGLLGDCLFDSKKEEKSKED